MIHSAAATIFTHSGAALAALLALVLGTTSQVSAQGPPLTNYNSRHYRIHTNLPERDAMMFARHMDRVFDEYGRRFQHAQFADQKQHEMLPLYLFRTAADYEKYLGAHGIPAQNTAGMFFYTQRLQGLAIWVQGRPIMESMATLQHEGFHQFAFRYIGTSLPIWVNEGIAQYFEDGILVGNDFHLNVAHARRVATVRTAIRQGRSISFARMLSMSDGAWAETVRSRPEDAALLYDQAWSMVYFLVRGDNFRYREPFGEYLQKVGGGMPSQEAFAQAFGSADPAPFERAWTRFVSTLEPDPIGETVDRLSFLGQSLNWMVQQNLAMPTTLPELRSRLQRHNYRAIRSSHHVRMVFDSSDNGNFQYPAPGRGGLRPFVLLAPERSDLPPRISAPGLVPEPTLVWYKDATGTLYSDIVYRK